MHQPARYVLKTAPLLKLQALPVRSDERYHKHNEFQVGIEDGRLMRSLHEDWAVEKQSFHIHSLHLGSWGETKLHRLVSLFTPNSEDMNVYYMPGDDASAKLLLEEESGRQSYTTEAQSALDALVGAWCDTNFKGSSYEITRCDDKAKLNVWTTKPDSL